MIKDGTYNLNTVREERNTGYYVACVSNKEAIKLTAQLADLMTISDCVQLVITAFPHVISWQRGLQGREVFVGVWTHKGKTYVEPSVWIENRISAIALGQTWKQKAIYDCANDKCIDIEYRK